MAVTPVLFVKLSLYFRPQATSTRDARCTCPFHLYFNTHDPIPSSTQHLAYYLFLPSFINAHTLTWNPGDGCGDREPYRSAPKRLALAPREFHSPLTRNLDEQRSRIDASTLWAT
ncbi:hypothetical protein QCA50_020880 [Cerrena zonata]|uniref:Uncharacterized protein n=1 Tax=Cerrena zonata TaxID=2478898 RepID=A0AAW0FAT6_9APHY